jgi:hypothetical protein
MAERFTRGARFRIADVGRITIPGLWKVAPVDSRWAFLGTAVHLAVLVVILAGWRRIATRSLDVLLLMFPIYFIAYCHVGLDAQSRFLMPFLPVLAVSLWFGMRIKVGWRTAAFSSLLLLHVSQAAGYWWLVDVPRTRTAARQVPSLERIGRRIIAENDDVPRQLVVGWLPRTSKCTLLLTTAGCVAWRESISDVQTTTFWLVVPRGTSVSTLAGRRVLSDGGFDLFLCARQQQAIVTHRTASGADSSVRTR